MQLNKSRCPEHTTSPESGLGCVAVGEAKKKFRFYVYALMETNKISSFHRNVVNRCNQTKVDVPGRTVSWDVWRSVRQKKVFDSMFTPAWKPMKMDEAL